MAPFISDSLFWSPEQALPIFLTAKFYRFSYHILRHDSFCYCKTHLQSSHSSFSMLPKYSKSSIDQVQNLFLHLISFINFFFKCTILLVIFFLWCLNVFSYIATYVSTNVVGRLTQYIKFVSKVNNMK